MSDQVLNYSEPPFCRPLADADMLLLQFALICHTCRAGRSATLAKKDEDGDGGDTSMDLHPSGMASAGLAFGGTGTVRLVNLLLHRFGVFDFLGFEKAPSANVDRYKQEIALGWYPPEIDNVKEDDGTEEGVGSSLAAETEVVLPWTYSPATDPATYLTLVSELLHLIIILITVRRRNYRSR